MIARNHVSALRRAKIASSPISLDGRAIVSSQMLGTVLISSTAGLARMFFGCAA
jgi:hypothetical protein